ncbi:type I-E CRISPR-associated protein Cas6/Cse3/CasE [Janthinobacterium sp. B9-8]|uniref:type I-E CRISPR-associated protein Cas6/Cse3/CasE n=1 Tax=Janthinobacterium sp. B9-8 TaxID=1236179 RepID=UPI00069B4E4D|nr:type I-E CRISPR-associated protein Cas6/Cse3/CasE [Janthinobacterium sp. B9-8]AMC33243.1 hypothetical protein VN23_00715 [Janthinobacterium sp. B9-8]
MSYFSRISIGHKALADGELSEAIGAGDAYRDHQLMWKLFPSEANTQRDFVFRAEVREQQATTRSLLYYIVSQREPVAWHSEVKVQSKPYAPLLEEGEWVHFDLRANPTVSVAAQKGQRGKRHDVLMHAKHLHKEQSVAQSAEAVEKAALAWLANRAANWGLQIDMESVQIDAYRQYKLHTKGREIQFSTVDYRGQAKVSNSERLSHALLSGISNKSQAGLGHSQGFGCGLLLVKRML